MWQQLANFGHLSFSVRRRLGDAARLPEYQIFALGCYLNNRGKPTPPHVALEECLENCWRVYLTAYVGNASLRPYRKPILRIIREAYLVDPANGRVVKKSNRLRSAVRKMLVDDGAERILQDSIQLAEIVKAAIPDLPWLVKDCIYKPSWIKHKAKIKYEEESDSTEAQDNSEDDDQIVESAISNIEIEVNEVVDDDLVQESLEGRIKYVIHKRRERNPELAAAKKRSFLKTFGRLYCEICGFDFEQTYGAVGEGFIECHHVIPISTYQEESITRLEDLKLLCANCHRMIHRLPLGEDLAVLKPNYRVDGLA